MNDDATTVRVMSAEGVPPRVAEVEAQLLAPGSPFALVRTEIDGQPIDDQNAFDFRFATKPIGGTAHLKVVRAGKELELSVPLQGPPDTAHDELVISARSPFQGAKISNLSPAVAEDLRLDASIEGVVILDVANGSAAQSLGFQRGDVVVSVNNTRIASTHDLERIAGVQTRLWRITIMRGGQQMSVELRG